MTLAVDVEPPGTPGEEAFAKPADDPKGRSVRGGVIAVASQGVRFVVRTASMMAMARLLTPEDFGLQGMVVAMTGFLALFRDAGLSAVTVQRETVSHDQISTLFWINVVVGAFLTVVVVVASPAIAAFYHDPRLTLMTTVSAVAFLINGLSVQHYALLQRQMRFVALGVIEVSSLVVSSTVGAVMAVLGYRYWSLVGMTVVLPIVTLVGCWVALPWRPGLPKRRSGMRSMLSMGGILTVNSLVVYLAYNTEKVLLGRFWGAEALGLYGRAYQLISLPADILISAIATVAFPALSRLQHDSERLQKAFLRGYSIVLALTIPTTVSCAIFADQIVRIMLGPKWGETVPIFRLMTPTIVAFALINPLAWFLISSGRVRRSMYIAFLIAPVVIAGALLGIRFGPKGVALAFSVMMVLLVVPVIAWARSGTTMTGSDLWRAIRSPLLAGVIAAVAGYAFRTTAGSVLPVLLHVCIGAALVYVVHFLILLYPLRQRHIYADLLSHLIRPAGSRATTKA